MSAPHVPDKLLEQIADYTLHYNAYSPLAMQTARLALLDSMGCAILALKFPECKKRLAPFFSGQKREAGFHLPGTDRILDPFEGAFSLGAQIRWLDYNDTWLGREWGHPSDNFATLLPLAEWRSAFDGEIRMKQILELAIKAYEIQGRLQLANAFNRQGFDHVILVKIASAAVATALLKGHKKQIISALSNAFADGAPLRAYRQAPNTGPRKSWAAGDAAARAVFLAHMALNEESALPTILSDPKWGVSHVLLNDAPLTLEGDLGCFVMENVLFKIAFPAEFHAQTAVEAAIHLHPQAKERLKNIASIEIETHESALRIIDKKGPLHNAADRDHCLQYMVACALIFGDLKADYYEAETASNSLIDLLRSKMTVKENPAFSADYLNPEKRSIANSLLIRFKDGSSLEKATVEYPLGHKRRRAEGTPLIKAKLEANLRSLPSLAPNIEEILSLFDDYEKLEQMTIGEFMALFTPSVLI